MEGKIAYVWQDKHLAGIRFWFDPPLDDGTRYSISGHDSVNNIKHVIEENGYKTVIGRDPNGKRRPLDEKIRMVFSSI
ncbi:MAG: hypothetical protein HY367_01205 [Candidatus Aenigmarchaeota archaeon]|nr:hypothetical protein [Candidatus Aenigmarchaeota archaeon]